MDNEDSRRYAPRHHLVYLLDGIHAWLTRSRLIRRPAPCDVTKPPEHAVDHACHQPIMNRPG